MIKLSAVRGYLSKTWVQWALAVVVFFGTSLFYMGPAITSCSTTTTAFNSDSTGGLAWFQWAGGNDLSWGYTDKSNYPVGESMDRPQYITSQAFFTPYKVLSSLTTPTCGLNLMLLAGYMSTALLMFGLIRWLFRRTAIAYFAGYGAAFVPFHQFKAQSHIVYASGAIFIAIIWTYLWFMQRPSYKRASAVALISALGFYTDGYFVLFTAVLLGSLIFFTLAQRLFALKYLRRQARYLAWFIGLLVIFLLPIAYTQKKHGPEIANSLSAARSNIYTEIKNYGARPVEFFVPSYNNPILPAGYQVWRLNQQHDSNPTEDTLFIGYSVAALGLLAIVTALAKRTRNLKLKENLSYRGLIVIAGGSMLTLFFFSLPYKYTFARILINLTDNWRVLSRFFLVIDPLAIILAAAGLYFLVRKWPRYLYLSFVGLLSVLLFCEYLTSPLRPHGDLYKDSPQIYQTIAKDKSVKVIAEYPLIDLATGPSTFTYAQVHGKSLVNANDSNIIRDNFHAAIAGLHDKQTIGVLKARGVDLVTTLGFDETDNPNLVSYFTPNVTVPHKGPPVFAYRISSNVQVRPVVLVTSGGFTALSVDPKLISHRVLVASGTMSIQNISSGSSAGQYDVSFGAQALQPNPVKLTVTQNKKVLWDGRLTDVQVKFAAAGDQPINLMVTGPVDVTNMKAE